MFSLLHALSYAGGLAAFLFVTLSLASGLLWLAELIEEHSRYAKIIGMRAIYGIIILHLALTITDSLPLPSILFSIFCHLIYLTNFSSTWPYISLTSPRFIASCILVVADHFIWFFHFAAKAQEAKKYRGPKYRYNSGPSGGEGQTFMDVAAFFGVCVWFVPLFLFLSLSANDNALPSLNPSAPASPGMNPNTVDLSTPSGLSSSQTHRQSRTRSSTSLIKSLLTPLLSLLPRLRTGGSRRKGADEGIIAPRTPIRGSPLHSPVPMAQNSYFPWSEDQSTSGTGTGSGNGTGTSSSTSAYTGLDPSSAGHTSGRRVVSRGATPPPPRRVQSEMYVPGQGSVGNPRGLATRGGRPAFGDESLKSAGGGTGGDMEGIAARRGLEVEGLPGGGSGASGKGGMSLGPNGSARVGGVEIVDSGLGAGKRKAD